MASWADQRTVAQALEAGIGEIPADPDTGVEEARQEQAARAVEDATRLPIGHDKAKARAAPTAPPPPGIAVPSPIRLVTPEAAPATRSARRSVFPALAALRPAPTITSAKPPPPNHGSMPSIVIGEARVGRETMVAIEAEERAGASPPLGLATASAPEIRVELVSMGRTTELHLRVEEANRVQSFADATSSDSVLSLATPR